MQIINGLEHAQNIVLPAAATIGNFDGVHLGHQAILDKLNVTAKQLNLASMLITFEPSPQEFFLGANSPARLTRLQEKLALLEHLKLDYVVILAFESWLANKNAKQFVGEILQQKLQVNYLLVGDDFRFGKNRLGNFSLLQAMADEKSFRVERNPTITLHTERVSSSRIRLALENGELATAERLLGRPYSMLGQVAIGQQRGRTIGFPTANIFLKRHRSPVLGVYAVKVYGLNKEVVYGVANVGNRPTVDGTRSLLEIHLFNFSEDIYGQNIQVEFCHKLRSEQHFANIDLLKQQIAKDSAQASDYFKL